MNKFPRRNYLIIILAFAILATAPLYTVSSQATGCSSCHSSPQPSAGYIFIEPTLSFSTPQSVPPNSSFTVQFIVTSPSKYSISNATATLSLNGEAELSAGEQAIKTVPSIPDTGGTATAEWTLNARNPGTILTNVTLSFTVQHSHGGSSNNNEFTGSLKSSHSVTVKTAALELSKAQVSFTTGESETQVFNVTARSEVRNVTISISPNLNDLITVTPNNIAAIPTGQNVPVQIHFNGNQSIVDNGRISIVWTDENGIMDSTFISITLTQPIDTNAATFSPLRWTGRISGSATLILLFASIGLGVIKMGKEQRVRLHCAISWFLLILSSYHGFVLIIGPYSAAPLTPDLIIGYSSTITIGIVSVNGLLEKRITNATNHGTWLWTHRVILLLGALLGVAHAVIIGTDMAFIRKLLGM